MSSVNYEADLGPTSNFRCHRTLLKRTGGTCDAFDCTPTIMHTHHAHSGQFCKHAVGTLEEVLHTAISKGFKVFGLSEHVPRYRRVDLYPEEVNATPLYYDIIL